MGARENKYSGGEPGVDRCKDDTGGLPASAEALGKYGVSDNIGVLSADIESVSSVFVRWSEQFHRGHARACSL